MDNQRKPEDTKEERSVEKWARSSMGGRAFREVERQVLLESPHAKQPTFFERIRKSGWFGALTMLMFISPIAGMAAPMSSPDITGYFRGFSPDTSLVVAGICFIISTGLVIYAMISWLRRERNRGDAIAPAIYVLVFSGITLLMVLGADALDETSGWAVPIYTSMALSVILLVAGLVAGKSKDDLPDDFDKPEHPVAIASLSDSEVDELLAIRNEILDILDEMERLDSEKIEEARHLPLGELYTLDDDN